jgi:TrmH family RNA methyltransferase
VVINSVNNFRVLQWCKLKNKTQRDKQKCFIAEGYHSVAEAFKAKCLTETISLEKSPPFDLPHHQVTYDIMEKLTSMATPAKIAGICRFPQPATYGDRIILVDQVHHPGNLGTIIRSAAAFGVDTIVVNASADVYNPKVVQASQGMLFHVNIIKKHLPPFITELKQSGHQIIGTDVHGGIALHHFQPNHKWAMIVGNEGDGVGEGLLTQCDAKITIPMNEKCESLNVGVAVSIILYTLKNNI